MMNCRLCGGEREKNAKFFRDDLYDCICFRPHLERFQDSPQFSPLVETLDHFSVLEIHKNDHRETKEQSNRSVLDICLPSIFSSSFLGTVVVLYPRFLDSFALRRKKRSCKVRRKNNRSLIHQAIPIVIVMALLACTVRNWGKRCFVSEEIFPPQNKKVLSLSTFNPFFLVGRERERVEKSPIQTGAKSSLSVKGY